MYKSFISGLIIILIGSNAISQSLGDFYAGIRIQKTHNLYYENGITLDYTHNFLLSKKIHLGFSFFTSRLGSAYNSNAIKQDNYLVTATCIFKNEKIISPLIQVNTGWFYSDMEEKMFESIPHTSPLLSLEAGFQLHLHFPVNAKATIGYNFITGDGINGPGTLYPLFYEFSIYYKFL